MVLHSSFWSDESGTQHLQSAKTGCDPPFCSVRRAAVAQNTVSFALEETLTRTTGPWPCQPGCAMTVALLVL